MAIAYKVIPRKSPKDRSVKYYAVKQTRPYGEKQFIENIVQRNTCTRADVLAVLSSVREELVGCIRNGMSVTLPEIGTFRFNLTSKGAETKDKFKSDNIKGLKLNFLPHPSLRYDVKVGNPEVKFYNTEQPEEQEP